MEFDKVIGNFGTIPSLKRFASAYVVDHTKLSEEETLAALAKAGPQYFHEENVQTAIEKALLNGNRDIRTITPILLHRVILNCDQFTSSQKETDEEIISWEKSIIDASNETLIGKKSSRSNAIELFKFVLSVAWENNDSISIDEKNLIEKIKDKLSITEREYRIMEASLGKFPRPGNSIHTREEIDNVRKYLQSAGLLASIRDSDKVDYDIVPEEIASILRKIFKSEIRRYGFEQLLESKYVRKKEWLTKTLEKSGLEIDGSPSTKELQEMIIERVSPTTLIGGITPRDGLGLDVIQKWCADLSLRASGAKGELIDRVVSFYDNLTSRNTNEEDPRSEWYLHYESFATRDRVFLRSQQIIDKDNEIESKFEDATNYLFEVKLGHKPLKLVATEHADGMLSHGDALILWDNKSKEGDVSLTSHIKQFDRYIGQQEKRVAGFLVIAPSYTDDSQAEAMRYQVEKGIPISLITAAELKSLAEKWAAKDTGAFPLGYLVLPGRFKPEVIPD